MSATKDAGPDARDDARAVASRYFRSWQGKDFDALAAVLADEVTFRGPLGTADDKQGCLAGLQGMSRVVERIEIQEMLTDGEQVLTWFELHTSVAPPVPTVNWSTVRDGRIVRIRVTFDLRPLLSR